MWDSSGNAMTMGMQWERQYKCHDKCNGNA